MNIFDHNWNHHKIGAASEVLVSADLMYRGYQVFRSLSGDASCDLMTIDPEGNVLKIEVKTLPGHITLSREKMLRYVNGKFDVLACVDKTSRTILYFDMSGEWID